MNEETPETAAGGEVAVYEDAGGEVRVEVRLDRETVWLTQRQMAEVFDSTPENVLMHLRNIFAGGACGFANGPPAPCTATWCRTSP